MSNCALTLFIKAGTTIPEQTVTGNKEKQTAKTDGDRNYTKKEDCLLVARVFEQSLTINLK